MTLHETTEAAAAALVTGFPDGRVVRLDYERRSADGRHLDALLEIEVGGARYEFEVEVKHQLNAAGAAHIAGRFGSRPGLLVVSEKVQPAVARALIERGVSYADTAGNCHVERPSLLVHVEGRKGEKAGSKSVRAFSGEGLRVLFVLLLRPDFASRPYRDLAVLSGASHGVVQYTTADLERLGFVVRSGRTGRRLRDVPALLDRWAAGYAESFRPKRSMGTFRFFNADAFSQWPDLVLDEERDRWGGEPAAALRTEFLKPGRLTVYTRDDRAALTRRLRLVPEEGGPVEALRTFWPLDLERALPDRFDGATTPDVLAYADLLASGDPRNAGLAATLREGIVTGYGGSGTAGG